MSEGVDTLLRWLSFLSSGTLGESRESLRDRRCTEKKSCSAQLLSFFGEANEVDDKKDENKEKDEQTADMICGLSLQSAYHFKVTGEIRHRSLSLLL